MTADPFDWDEELPPETEAEVYRALLRALQRKQGFGLFFVQCTPFQGTKILADLRRDLPRQRIQALHLQGEVTKLSDQIVALWQQRPFDVLVVDGLEASLYAYEDVKRLSGWSSEEVYNYRWKDVPKLLNHLNQGREHLRDEFPTRLVFLVPPFVVDYFIQRAPDFLDWRSGLFRFPRNLKEIAEDVDRFIGRNYTKYLDLPSHERIKKILELKSLLKDCSNAELQTSFLSKLGLFLAKILKLRNLLKDRSNAELQINLLFELGLLFAAEQDYGNAITSFDKAIELKSDYHEAWYNRGVALNNLGRKQEAVTSFDKAIELKTDFYPAWYNRGTILSDLGRKQEAVTSFDKAIELKPDYHEAWYNRGNALSDLGCKQEAIASFDKAIEIKADDHQAWNNRGAVLVQLQQFGQAHKSFDQAILLKLDNANAHYNKACCYGLQGQIDQAIETLQHAITIDAKYREWAKTDSDFDSIRQDERFQRLTVE